MHVYVTGAGDGERSNVSIRRNVGPLVIAAVLGVTALGAASCSNGGDKKGDPATTATTPTTGATTTTSSPEQAVLAAYRAFWDGYLKAADPMDPRNPVLAQVAAGDELQQVQRAFLARQSAGEVIRGTLDLAPAVQSVNGSSATVTDCYADHTGIYDAASGARKDQESGVRHRVTVQVVLDGSTWKVSTITREGDGCTPSGA